MNLIMKKNNKTDLETELSRIKQTKNYILIAGYDKDLIENNHYLYGMEQAIKRGVHVGTIIHTKDCADHIENLLHQSSNTFFGKTDNEYLVNRGYRIFDHRFTVRYCKNIIDTNISIRREYDNYFLITNFGLRLAYFYLFRFRLRKEGCDHSSDRVDFSDYPEIF